MIGSGEKEGEDDRVKVAARAEGLWRSAPPPRRIQVTATFLRATSFSH